jgi:hypothetical protein
MTLKHPPYDEEMTDDAGRQAESMTGALESAIPIAHKMGVRVVEARRGYAVATPRRRCPSRAMETTSAA